MQLSQTATNFPDVLTANNCPESPSLCSHSTSGFRRLAASPEVSFNSLNLDLTQLVRNVRAHRSPSTKNGRQNSTGYH